MPAARMYSPGSPSVLSSLNASEQFGCSMQQQQQTSSQCLRFKYFTTFLICTTCLGLLSASLATHKWIVSRPIRSLKLNQNQASTTNFTALMLTTNSNRHQNLPLLSSLSLAASGAEWPTASSMGDSEEQAFSSSSSQQNNNKFQGEIYFGLFKGVKVLNYGFGDRISPISVIQNSFAKTLSGQQQQQQTTTTSKHQQQELVNFKFWLVTLVSVSLAILAALIGSIFAIINFVMTPRGTLTGPVGLVIWNAAACFACLLALVSWLIEYFVRLRVNVLTMEEVQNGWTSENRSQFGYSYYLVVLAFILHLVNIFIVSIVQFESWTTNKAASQKRQSRSSNCEGIIMLY